MTGVMTSSTSDTTSVTTRDTGKPALAKQLLDEIKEAESDNC
jgi:hypothetical protein